MNTKHNQIDKDLPVVEPVLDTWGGKENAGNWGLDGKFEWEDFSIEKINAWYADSLIKTLEAFTYLARIWEVVLVNDGTSRGDIGGIFKLESYDSYEKYIENILKRIREHPVPIYEIWLKVDMFVYVKTVISPETNRFWIRDLGKFCISVDQEDEDSYLYLDIENTLFRPMDYRFDKNNTELFNLNQPLLEEALKNW
ncbi:MAG: hypothetical protein AAGF83_19950 [Cyanobacteria bacterium P01_G01_bin.67]